MVSVTWVSITCDNDVRFFSKELGLLHYQQPLCGEQTLCVG